MITKCCIEGCDKPRERRGLCQMHHWRLRTHGSPFLTPGKRTGCSVEGCDRPHARRGHCDLHASRLKRNGTTNLLPRKGLSPKSYRSVKRIGHPLANAKTGRVNEHRAVLFDATGDVRVPCFWCGAPLRWHRGLKQPADSIIVDHRDHDRHNNSPTNLLPACNSCNCKRSHWSRVKLVPIYRPVGEFTWKGTQEIVGS